MMNNYIKIWFWRGSISLAYFNSQSHTAEAWTSLKVKCGRCILISIWIWSLVYATPKFQIWLSIMIWRCKEKLCPCSPDFGLWGMLEVPDWGLSSWPWFGYGHGSLIYPFFEFNLAILILRCKEHPCPLSPHLGLWRRLEIPDLGLASLS